MVVFGTNDCRVATVPTACGIETIVLNLHAGSDFDGELQQYLPLAVLKLNGWLLHEDQDIRISCNSTYRLRY